MIKKPKNTRRKDCGLTILHLTTIFHGGNNEQVHQDELCGEQYNTPFQGFRIHKYECPCPQTCQLEDTLINHFRNASFQINDLSHRATCFL